MELDRRKQRLLQVIVESYVQRAEPVGSHFLASQPELGVRSATIRNELAEMTDLGYLRQPHTSAGRIPSDQGYRFYVDHLMAWERLSAGEARTLRTANRVSEGDLEQLLVQTCRALTSITRYTSVGALPANEEPSIRQVHLVQVADRRLLAVVVLDNGQVVHRFYELTRPLVPREVTMISNALDQALREVSVKRASSVSITDDEMNPYQDMVRALIGVIGRGVVQEDGDLVLEGASHILEQPEFREANKVEPLVRFLEARRSAFETLRRMMSESHIRVSIGQENPHEAMQEVSLIAARYEAAGRFGWVGVLGPTRMHYDQAVSAVRYAAQVLSESMARLPLG